MRVSRVTINSIKDEGVVRSHKKGIGPDLPGFFVLQIGSCEVEAAIVT